MRGSGKGTTEKCITWPEMLKNALIPKKSFPARRASSLSQRATIRMRRFPNTQYALRNTHHGLIARYARFGDYHDILGERLKELTSFIDALQPGTKSLWYVDT